MAYRREDFSVDEWYHCYSRSIDGQSVYLTEHDYERFLQALYICNGSKMVRRGTMRNPSHVRLMSIEKGKSLVSIGAFCLMPNHFHLLLREIREGGISTFMQKLGTSFSMYFNVKYGHVGNIFIKPFRSRHIQDDEYLNHVIQYIHLNPAELYEKDWKKGRVRSIDNLERKLRAYRFSSLRDYEGVRRPETAILDARSMTHANLPPLKKVLSEAAEYYASLPV